MLGDNSGPAYYSAVSGLNLAVSVFLSFAKKQYIGGMFIVSEIWQVTQASKLWD